MNEPESLPSVPTNTVTAIGDYNDNNNQNSINEIIHSNYKWRNLIAFYLLGLCNGYGYVVMLSAANDIIGRFDGFPVNKPIFS